jgi:uncharacterized SAM-binding protein YcdF (DUF218 family)
MSTTRLVAVLGYSNGTGSALHHVCAARLERAAAEVQPEDVVLLTGRARGRRPPASEAGLMAGSWNGRTARVVLDHDARSTLGNVLAAAATARELEAQEVVLVTSGWHGRRASTLLRAALRGSGVRVALAMTDERGSVSTRLRELACWGLVPLQAALATRRR